MCLLDSVQLAAANVPVVIVNQMPPQDWLTSVSTLGAIVVALGTLVLSVAAIVQANVTRGMVAASQRAEQLRFTDKAILQMVEPEMRDALNNLQGHGAAGDKALAARMFATVDPTSRVNEWTEPSKSYMEAVGLYMNLFDRISAYSGAGIIDEPLYFSQYDFLVTYLYFLLSPYIWEPGTHVPAPSVTRFATRAFLHVAEDLEKPALGVDILDFYEGRARKYYPGDKTDRILARARGRPLR
jgi:hypothetical protein